MAIRYWLFKTEPETFSIDDLMASPHQTTTWEGVRNYQARNLIRDQMQEDDRVLIYHSVKNPSVVGTGTIVRAGYPDHFAWDKRHNYFDPKSSPENPTWYMVDLRFDKKFPAPLLLIDLRKEEALAEMELLRKGSRLSVQPVKKQEWTKILKLAQI
jgi:predicted RNA-binding protein with PUA-like domain